MAQQRNKGQAGMGGRGKNQERYRQDVGTAKRERNSRGANEKGGATLSRPSNEPRKDTKRNQDQWHQRKRQRSRY
jgi:hypothetical protein